MWVPHSLNALPDTRIIAGLFRTTPILLPPLQQLDGCTRARPAAHLPSPRSRVSYVDIPTGVFVAEVATLV
jgi:hypothetical protein